MLDGVLYEMTPNQYAIIPATSKPLYYWADQSDPWTIYWVHFTGPHINQFNSLLGINSAIGPKSIPHNETGIRIWELMYESLEMGYSSENLTNANLCLYHLIATFIYPDKHIHTGSEPNKTIIHRTISFMKENLDNKIMVEDLAQLNGLSNSRFSTLFRKSTGMPPIDYFIHLKMQKACQLLYTTDFRVKEVAFMIGYDDPYFFSRLFKKNMNLSPEDYRLSVKSAVKGTNVGKKAR